MREEIRELLRLYRALGCKQLVALRGDLPSGMARMGDLRFASDLVSFIRSEHDGYFRIHVGCYPEMHPEAVDRDDDLRWAKEKVARGARVLITQLFFSNADYFDYVDRARALGITAPIVPGIMPITNVAQIERFTKICGTRIPADLQTRLDRYRDEANSVMAVGIEHAIRQCRELLDGGAPGLHFFTLNKSLATRAILAGLR